ncbi:MAG: hypothetical protein M3R59_01325 [Verrucomicrobiota bacterium]|nr:hypothetical protein [Verrucomicrobiota bacterium]
MKRLLAFLLLASVGAIDAAENPEPSPAARIELRKKSTFVADAGARNPFWPIGWKPTAHIGNGADNANGAAVPASAFTVTSITLETGAHFAIINGKTMTEGQQFGLQMGSQVYQITVKAIEDGRVILARRDEEIVVPLRRK